MTDASYRSLVHSSYVFSCWLCTCTCVTVRALQNSYCAFDAKLYDSAMTPAFRVHGCKMPLNQKGKQMAENCCSAAHGIEHSPRQDHKQGTSSLQPHGVKIMPENCTKRFIGAIVRLHTCVNQGKLVIKKKSNKSPESSK